MGVNTHIDLTTLNTLFPEYNFTELHPTSDGVIDTTYIITNKQESYILKYFDRDISQQIKQDKQLLTTLHQAGLNVPLYLNEQKGWYLFKRLKGSSPKNIHLFHIQTLARFMAKYHSHTRNYQCENSFFAPYNINEKLYFLKKKFYLHYKKLEPLKRYKPKYEGFIHGDIFTDNTVFEKNKIGVFDFIDGGCGEFLFDIAVALLSFSQKQKPSDLKVFINTYNRFSSNKIKEKELKAMIKTAAQFYALLRLSRYENTQRANELLKLC